MSKYIALTSIGKDKFGIVSVVSEVLYKEKCNIEESTMTILYGQFVMMLIIKLHSNISTKTLLNKLKKYSQSFSMSLFYKDINSYTSKKQLTRNPFIISVYGLDTNGILYNISKYLACNKVNITDVQTTLSNQEGKNIYIMVIEADFPANVLEKEIFQGLLKLAKPLSVTISINQAESSDI
jgi:predicted amino acid-binding ACT domain protein